MREIGPSVREKRKVQVQRVLLLLISLSVIAIPRQPKRNLPRTDWQSFSSHETDDEFRNMYRVSRVLFVKILAKILVHVKTDSIMANRSSAGPISPEVMLAISLRMCAGARYQDLRRCFNVSKASIYVVFRKVITAINNVEVIEFPMSDTAKMAELSAGFDRLTGGVLTGCCLAVDGFCVRIGKPKIRECANPAAYFNRKGFYSLALQAGCDAQRRILFASICCAGEYHNYNNSVVICWVQFLLEYS
jgi:hypothetical protein